MVDSLAHDAIAAAAALAPLIRDARDELDSARRLPAYLVEALDKAGLLRLGLPKLLGGRETDPITSFHAIEELSKADGSVGWCSFLSSGGAVMMGWLGNKAGREIVGKFPSIRIAGSLRPEGEALLVDGGYRISGRWDFGSGIDHATWVMCTCKIVDTGGPVLRDNGEQDTRTIFVPAHNVQVHYVWHVMGMRGTGSNNFTVEGVFVPTTMAFSIGEEAKQMGPLFDRRLSMVNLWANNAANALGVARSAMDAFVELATQSGSTRSTILLRDRAPVQNTVGQAEAIISAARAYVLDTVGMAWKAVCDGAIDPSPEITQARLAIAHSIHESVRAVDLLFHAAGTNAIHSKFSLERHFRDIHVAVTHAAGLDRNIELGGKIMLGFPPEAAGW